MKTKREVLNTVILPLTSYSPFLNLKRNYLGLGDEPHVSAAANGTSLLCGSNPWMVSTRSDIAGQDNACSVD